MNRIFQVSLRTIFEVTFVVAVVLGFVYWRGQPRGASQGRYQLFVDTEKMLTSQVLFDTQTGRTWHRTGAKPWREWGTAPEQ
jgi:hypothetical protein